MSISSHPHVGLSGKLASERVYNVRFINGDAIEGSTARRTRDAAVVLSLPADMRSVGDSVSEIGIGNGRSRYGTAPPASAGKIR